MINVHSQDYVDKHGTVGEIRIGWASWDFDKHNSGSVKWAYKDEAGRISRGAPEVPIDVLVAMIKAVLKQELFFPIEDQHAISELKELCQNVSG